MKAGQTKVVRPGNPGVRNVTYLLVFENGKLAAKHVKSQDVLKKPKAKVVRIGTKVPPARGTRSPSASPAATGTSTPATATTAGCSSASAPGTPTAAPGCPSQHSRETQIAIATKLRDASGGYGAWPACAHRWVFRPDLSTTFRGPLTRQKLRRSAAGEQFLTGRRTWHQRQPPPDLTTAFHPPSARLTCPP